MVALFWQTALLLLAAYFVGALCGCMLRRLLFPGTLKAREAATAPAAAPRQEAAPAPTAANRFERALTGEESQPAPAAAAPEAPRAEPPVASQIEQITPSTRPAAQPAETATPSATTAAIATGVAATAATVATAAVARESAAPEPSQTPAPEPAPAPAGPIPQRPEETLPPREAAGDVAGRHAQTWSAAAAHSDDLEQIEGIDQDIAAKLKQSGIESFKEIADWSAADVKRLSSDLGVGDAITRQNWMEQAAVLAKGGTTAYAKRRTGLALASPSEDTGVSRNIQRELGAGIAIPGASAPAAAPAPSPTPEPQQEVYPAAGTGEGTAVAARIERIDLGGAAQQASSTSTVTATATAAAAAAAGVVAAGAAMAAQSQTQTPPAATQPAIGERDDLTKIAGITPEIERVLNGHGVTRIAQVAGWSASDVTRFDGLLGSARIAREDWVGQAQRMIGMSAPTPAAQTPAAPAAAAPTPTATNMQAMRSVRSAALVGAAGAQRQAEPDDLKRIRGIGILAERRLISMGIESYEQIAEWTDADVKRVSEALDLGDKVGRENWIAQARMLLGEPAKMAAAVAASSAPSAAAAAQAASAPAVDATAMAATAAAAAAAATSAGTQTAQSEAAPAAAPLMSRPGAGAGDDLKRIRGVGILIERKLKQLGISSYEEIANWTSSDIERVNAVLDFNGRIERENWIEQARILASGGHTEFSRRMDRGEV